MNLNLIDKPDSAVITYLKVFARFNSNLVHISNLPIIIRKDIGELNDKVVILSGGGSGHEPAHVGFVGKGMISAAVAGEIFASPPPNIILEGIIQIGKDNISGVLIIVKNYTGDRINFNIAAERARKIGIIVEIIIVGEDTALESDNKACGRRGLAGTVLIHKIAGAMAEKMYKLHEIKQFLNTILTPGIMGTVGMAFTNAVDNLQAHDRLYELGLGIHGEAGVKRRKFENTGLLIDEMVKHLTTSGTGHLTLKHGDRVVVLINNLGSCTQLELFIIAGSLINYLESEYHLTVMRCYCGNYVTSLHMYGVSFTVLKVMNECIIEYLDFPVESYGWNNLVHKFQVEPYIESQSKPVVYNRQIIETSEESARYGNISENDFYYLNKAILAACDALLSQEDYLNDLDKEIGDSDCGTTFKRGALAIKDFITEWNKATVKCIPVLLSNFSLIIEDHMGGSSGGLLSLFFEAILRKYNENPKSLWCDIFLESTDIISNVGGAVEGSRTMLDVLYPVFKAWRSMKNDAMNVIMPKLANVAQKSSQLTQTMIPKAGRASYVNSQKFGKYPDPGAEAINIIIKAISEIY